MNSSPLFIENICEGCCKKYEVHVNNVFHQDACKECKSIRLVLIDIEYPNNYSIWAEYDYITKNGHRFYVAFRGSHTECENYIANNPLDKNLLDGIYQEVK